MNSKTAWDIKKELLGIESLDSATAIKIATQFKVRPRVIRNVFNGTLMGHVKGPTTADLDIDYKRSLANRSGTPSRKPNKVNRKAVITSCMEKYPKATVALNC